MNNYVKIHYSGKDYIGEIYSIESEWNCLRMFGKPEIERNVVFYNVSIYEKDTGCLIENIYVKSFNEIKPFKGE